MVRRMNAAAPVGHLLREWRQRRRMSQLDFACEAEISSKHLSFLETGRSQPSREMLLAPRRTARCAAPRAQRDADFRGFRPIFTERALSDPALNAAREAVDLVLKGHEPYPALAIDRHWTLLASNGAVTPLLAGSRRGTAQAAAECSAIESASRRSRAAHCESRRMARASVSRGCGARSMSPRIRCLSRCSTSWRNILRLQPMAANGVTMILRRRAVPLRGGRSVLSFISTTTVFGTPIDITLSELALESFFPADEMTAAALQRRE